MLISIITVLAILGLLIISVSVYRKKHTDHAQTPVEIIATSVAEKATNMFNSKPAAPVVIRSKYFPDQLYIGKTIKLDSSLKFMFTNLLFGFPDAPLIVKEFKYFEIDGNPFEEIVFEKVGAKNYIMLHDSFEETNYFLNRVMTKNTAGYPRMLMVEDEVSLTENDQKYVYQDFSGLIEVKVRDDKGFKNNRLIRVYAREITPDDSEYLILIVDKPDVLDYYIGFTTSIHQLEDL